MDPVVDVAWLRAHRDEVVVADVRHYLDGRSSRAAYESGHLPAAVFVDLHGALADPPSPQRGRHPFPPPEHFAAGLGALGIGDDDPVVAYDDTGGMMAARLVWMLRAIGQPAALLDGGIQAWDGPLEREPTDRAPVTRTPRQWPTERLAGIDEVAETTAPLLDARSGARFRGEEEPLDPRAGHIPGATSVPTAGNLAPDGRFRTPAALRERFARAGLPAEETPIAYCGSGVSACHLLLAMEHAGLGTGRLYPGSWSQWSADPARPAGKGDGMQRFNDA
jgi:thiosulfate/3-mercaptopyruvate sulfurtransferase